MIAFVHLGIQGRDDVLGLCTGGNGIRIVGFYNVLEGPVLAKGTDGSE